MASVRALTLFPLILSSIAQPVSPVRYPKAETTYPCSVNLKLTVTDPSR